MGERISRRKQPPPWFVLAGVAVAGVVAGVLAYRT